MKSAISFACSTRRLNQKGLKEIKLQKYMHYSVYLLISVANNFVSQPNPMEYFDLYFAKSFDTMSWLNKKNLFSYWYTYVFCIRALGILYRIHSGRFRLCGNNHPWLDIFRRYFCNLLQIFHWHILGKVVMHSTCFLFESSEFDLI